MGVSTDGILFYGFPVEDESKLHYRIAEYDEESDTGDALAKLSYSGDADGGVEIGYHCSDGYTQYFIAAEGSTQRAWRGHPKEAKFDIDPEWNQIIETFCKKYDIKPQKPKWWLCSYWG